MQCLTSSGYSRQHGDKTLPQLYTIALGMHPALDSFNFYQDEFGGTETIRVADVGVIESGLIGGSAT